MYDGLRRGNMSTLIFGDSAKLTSFCTHSFLKIAWLLDISKILIALVGENY